MKRDDLMWKAVLEDTFDDFLRFFYRDADAIFDMKKGFEYLDKELEQLFPPENQEFAPRFVDKLVKVFKKDGSENWMLIHVEVQGQYDKNFSERMFTYFYRIKDKYDRPITALAIFTDRNRRFHPSKFEYEHIGTRISYEYNTYKVIDQDEEELANNPNPFSLVILTVLTALKTKRMDDDILLHLKRNLLRLMLQKRLSRKSRNGIFNFIRFYVNFQNQENKLIFDNDVEQLIGRTTPMGTEQYLKERFTNEGLREGLKKGEKLGKKQGREEKNEQTVKNLIEQLDLTDTQIAGIVEVPVEFVQKIRAKLKK